MVAHSAAIFHRNIKCNIQKIPEIMKILIVFLSSKTISPSIQIAIATNPNHWPIGFSRNREITPEKREFKSIIESVYRIFLRSIKKDFVLQNLFNFSLNIYNAIFYM